MTPGSNLPPDPGPSAHFVFDVGGMTCAACSARVEKVLARQPGVRTARVNLALERADIAVGDGADADQLARAIEKAGYTAVLRVSDREKQRHADAAREEARAAEERGTLMRFAVSALFAVPLVVAGLPMMLGLSANMPMSPWVQAALAGGVLVFSGSRFYREAWAALRTGGSNMATLVSLGATAAFGWSLWLTATGASHHHDLYFEAAAVVPTLVMLGKWLEARAKRGASAALSALARLKPVTATRLSGDRIETIDAEALAPGDRVRVKPGERFPCDGVILSGRTSADESLLTGESLPIDKQPGDTVVTGALNGDGVVDIEVARIGEDTQLARIIRLVEAAQIGEAPVQRLADRVSAIFVPVILALAVLTFLGWWALAGNAEAGLSPAIAVLVIACPCALGLATPTALVAGTGAAARAGILIRDIEALDRARDVRIVAFDKTGTLTLGTPRVVAVGSADADGPPVLELAAALEAGSSHPLAQGIMAAAGQWPMATAMRTHRGEGVAGDIGGHAVAVGNPAMMERAGIDDAALAAFTPRPPEAATVAWVARDGKLAGYVALADEPRPEAASALAALAARGIGTVMITGDNEATAAAMAKRLGVADWRSGVRPEGKLAAVRALREHGAVAFVGDGLNDGPALAAADLGVALSSGADVAREAAAVTLMRPDLRLVSATLDISARTRRTIVQNLAWAFVYNVIGIPLAAFGILSPVFAGAAMAFSSVSVATNSALLARWRPRP